MLAFHKVGIPGMFAGDTLPVVGTTVPLSCPRERIMRNARIEVGRIEFNSGYKPRLPRVVVAYQFSPNSHVVTELTDFLDSIDKLNNELPFIASTISDILNTDCSVNQLSACVDLRATTDKDLKVKYTMQDVGFLVAVLRFVPNGAVISR